MRIRNHHACALAIVVAATGCDWLLGKEIKPEYCAQHPNDSECPRIDGGTDGPESCSSSAECEAPTSVCDVMGSMTCVECTPDEDGVCIGTTPVCANNACEACTAHSQCDSEVCLDDGSCAVESAVAYVDADGTDNSSCMKAMPCTVVAKALDTSRPYVKIVGTIDEAVTVDGSQAVAFVGETGAKLTRTNNGQLFRVEGAAQVQIFDLEISGALGTNVGISIPVGSTATLSLTRAKVSNNAGGGISVSGGMLTIARSTISANAGGGISISGAQFDITNSFITGNGGASTGFGGVRFDQIAGGTRRFEFNTVTNNVAAAGVTTGVVCTLVTQATTFSNNIVYDNQTGGGRTQVGGNNCSWTYSDIGPDTVGGIGNINEDPLFVNAGQNNFHIMPTSPAKDAADLTATLSIDFDGDTRPQGSGRDIGADEAP